jgi:hypothetical protein
VIIKKCLEKVRINYNFFKKHYIRNKKKTDLKEQN